MDVDIGHLPPMMPLVCGSKAKVKVEGKKRPVMMDVDYDYDMNEVKYTKYIISFK